MATRGRFPGIPRRPQRVKCIAYPNRRKRRIFTPRKVGAIVCRMLRDAASLDIKGGSLAVLRADLRRELDRCFPCEEGQQEPKTAVAAAIAIAQAQISENSTVIAIAIAVLAALFILPRLFAALPPALLALVPVAARSAITQIPGVLARLRATRAANEELFRKVAGF